MTALPTSPAAQAPLPLFSTAAGIVDPDAVPVFAHPAEQELAKLLTFFNIRWTYEPTTFALRRHEDGTISEAFTPDFFLPDHRLYLELTTMRQKLVTRKNRKARLLRELYPGVRLQLIYRSDFLRLMECYGDALARGADAGRESILRSGPEIDRAIDDFACMIIARAVRERDQRPIVLTSASRSSRRFQRDLAQRIRALGGEVELAALTSSQPDTPFVQPRYRASRASIDRMTRGHVVLVETLVSSGLNTMHAQRWLREREIALHGTLALFARTSCRFGDITLDAVAFDAPNDVLAGYGLQLRSAHEDRPEVVSLRAGSSSYAVEMLAALGIQ